MWLSVDESTDSEGYFIVNVIVGTLNKEQNTIPYLLNMCELPTTNNVTDSLKLLWPSVVKYDWLLLFVIDAGNYMVK